MGEKKGRSTQGKHPNKNLHGAQSVRRKEEQTTGREMKHIESAPKKRVDSKGAWTLP